MYVVVTGPPASGKSTLAGALAELVAPATWLSGPGGATISWGDPDDLIWVRGALERTEIRHRAHPPLPTPRSLVSAMS